MSLNLHAEDLVVRKAEDGVYFARLGETMYPCSVGKGGIVVDKREGDAGTPAGTFPFRRVLFRSDKIPSGAIETRLPAQALNKNDGWCDDVSNPYYNQFVTLPFTGSHEKLWREDSVYDIIVIIGHNDSPPLLGKGSAVFVHVAREGYTPTLGCVGFAKEDLLKILSSLTEDSQIVIDGGSSINLAKNTEL